MTRKQRIKRCVDALKGYTTQSFVGETITWEIINSHLIQTCGNETVKTYLGPITLEILERRLGIN